MSAAYWAAYAAVSAAAVAAVFYLYRRREPPGRGRTLLALLRGAAIALLFLILFDPRLKQPIDRAAARRAPILVDGSLSMMLPLRDGQRGDTANTQWRHAVAEARKRASSGAGNIVVFGDVPRSVSADSLAKSQPGAVHSRLLPALQAAVEAGASAVTVISDRNLEDADAVARWIPRLGAQVTWVDPASAARDLALTEISAPAWGEAGKALDIALGVQTSRGNGNEPTGDSASVTLRQDGAVIGTQRFAVPAPGRVAAMHVSVRPRAPQGGGYVRIEATIDSNDGFADDDVRNAYVYVSDEPAGIVLVSLAPDWEPRFLLPVLERAAALPARGYLRAANGTWVRAASGLEAGANVNDAVVQKAVAAADLLLVHNARGDAPAWLTDAMKTARRMIVFPADGSAVALPLPVRIGVPAADDWFVSGDVPASPVSPLLSGVKVDDIPPIESLAIAEVGPGTWAPLNATRGRRGVPAPLAIAGEDAGRRWAVALGSGYWRWAFQGGAAGDVYNRLWSSLGGWLMRDAQSADIAAVRPVQRAVFRAEPIQWVSRAGAMDSVRVSLEQVHRPLNDPRSSTAAAGLAPAPRVATMAAHRDTASLENVEPGTYTYTATAFAGGSSVTSTGEVTVETYSPEFARISSTVDEQGAGKDKATALRRTADTKPLHALWLPYAILMLLLATEWILRRRWGLR